MIDEGGEEEVAFWLGIADVDGDIEGMCQRMNEGVHAAGVSCGDD